jgi:hypothetical protein
MLLLKSGSIFISTLTFRSCSNILKLTSKRYLSLGNWSRKSFKHKPERPKFKLHTPEELFGDPKGWNVPPGGYLLLASK